MESRICLQLLNLIKRRQLFRTFSTAATSEAVAETSRQTKSENAQKPKNDFVVKTQMAIPSRLREVFPDFMPEPDFSKRNPISEKLERMDMMRRREVVDIPEFYVGSIMAVTMSDPYAPSRVHRFVGICIARDDRGLRHYFTLRNVIDGFGVEIRYYVYHPFILKIEVLKLEKRLDDELYYLRDAPQEYSTIPFNFDPVAIKPNAPVPINETKVKLKPGKWCSRWEKRGMKGIDDVWSTVINPWWQDKFRRKTVETWRKYEIIEQYQRMIPEKDQRVIYDELVEFNDEISRKTSRRRTLLSPLYRTKPKRQQQSGAPGSVTK